MLGYLCIWFSAFLFAGIMVPEVPAVPTSSHPLPLLFCGVLWHRQTKAWAAPRWLCNAWRKLFPSFAAPAAQCAELMQRGLLRQRDVIWPFRIFMYCLPLRWVLSSMVLHPPSLSHVLSCCDVHD